MSARSVRRLAVLLAAATVPLARAKAQSNAVAPSPWSVYSVRFDTRTSNFIYAVYGYGSTFAMVGALDNPRSGYTELLAAAGRTFSLGPKPSQFVAAGIARAETWYAQVYFLPTVRAGAVWLRATSEWDVPVASGGALQFSLSPISGTVRLGNHLEAGLGADVAMARGSRTGTDVGPELRIGLPKATLSVDAQRSLDQARSRLRLSFLAAF